MDLIVSVPEFTHLLRKSPLYKLENERVNPGIMVVLPSALALAQFQVHIL